MATIAKTTRSAVHTMFSAQSIAAADTVSADIIAMQRNADESAALYVSLSGDPGANPNAFLCIEARAEDGSTAWCEVARIGLTNAAQGTNGPVPPEAQGGIVFLANTNWSFMFPFKAGVQVRVATRAIGGAYGSPAGNMTVHIVE